MTSAHNTNVVPSSSRPYDVIVFGATGFTGRLAATYLSRRYSGTAVKYALSGRDAEQTKRVAEETNHHHAGGGRRGLEKMRSCVSLMLRASTLRN